MTGPLTLVAATVAGVLAGQRLGPGGAVGALLFGAVSAVGALRSAGGASRLALGMVAVALLGAASMQRALDGVVHSPITRLQAERSEVTIGGSLVDDPDGGPYTTRVLVRVGHADGRLAGNRTALVASGGDVASRLRLLQVGDTVELSGYFAPLRGFDRRFRWRHAVAEFRATELLGFVPSGSPLIRAANALRERVLTGGRNLPPTERALVAGFLLGDTRALPRQVEEQFRNSGLSHLLAVSGTNVAFVLSVARPFLRRLGLRAQLVGGLTVLVLFGTMTRWEPSVLRACVMAACSMTALYLGRPTAGVRVLAIAVIVLLLADPFLLHSVAFLLSCGASAGIAILGAPLATRLRGPAWLREGLAVPLSAQLGVAPVLIPVFGSVPTAALPANLLAVPLAGPLTVWGLASGLGGGLAEPRWPGLATALQAPTHVLAQAMLGIAAAGSRVPVAIDGRAAWALLGLASLAGAMRLRRNLRGDAHVPPR